MATILCPTRGGEESIKNLEKSIQIASERGWNILFLYVSNTSFLLNFGSPVVMKNIENELEDMGEFILTAAQEKAEKMGVKADILIKSGTFRDILKAVIAETHTAILILGSSAGGTGVMTREYLLQLIQHIHADTGVEVFVLKNGEITDHLEGAS